MKVDKFNISKPTKWVDKQGVEQTKWNNVGVYTEFHKPDGTIRRILEIPAIGLEAVIFPFKTKEEQSINKPLKPEVEDNVGFDF